MRRVLSTLAVLLGVLFTWADRAAADLYVVRIGDGAAALSSSTSPVSVVQYADTGGTPLSTINMPTMASGAHQPLTLTGTATSVGFLTLSTNGEYLTLGGFASAPGVANVRETNAADVNRVVGRIEISTGNVDTTTALTDAYKGQTGSNADVRSVASTDGTDFWLSGTGFFTGEGSNSAGIRYTTLGSTTSTRVTPPFPFLTNTRVVNIFDGDLYTSSMSGAYHGISKVGDGLETQESQAIPEPLPGFEDTTTGRDSWDFWFKDANTLYVADGRFLDSGGGIQRWDFNDETTQWNLSYTLNDTSATAGVRGLAGTIVNGDTVLYATTAQTSANRIVTVTDAGPSSMFTVLAQAPTNTVFRGVEWVFAESAALDGDYNNDGKVDAADYVVWRKDPSANGGAQGYNVWAANFGMMSPGGGSGQGLAVPEPACLSLLLVGFLGLCGARRRA